MNMKKILSRGIAPFDRYIIRDIYVYFVKRIWKNCE